MHIYICICIYIISLNVCEYIYVHTYIYLYIYIYLERESKKEKKIRRCLHLVLDMFEVTLCSTFAVAASLMKTPVNFLVTTRQNPLISCIHSDHVSAS